MAKSGWGFRIPTIIVSPFTVNSTRAPHVSHTLFDHTSVLKLIDWRWGIEPLTPRDASPMIGDPATSLNFGLPAAQAPVLPTASRVLAKQCFEGGIFEEAAITSDRPGRILETE